MIKDYNFLNVIWQLAVLNTLKWGLLSECNGRGVERTGRKKVSYFVEHLSAVGSSDALPT